jgi:hypothetical protein
MFDPRPEHVRISEGIGLLINRPIYQLGRPIFSRFRLVFTRRRRFLTGRPAVAPRPILGRIWPLFTPPSWFSSAAYSPLRPTRFIGSTADYRLILIGFRPAAADFGPPGPTSAPLSTGVNRK